jgi:hypothetical protein
MPLNSNVSVNKSYVNQKKKSTFMGYRSRVRFESHLIAHSLSIPCLLVFIDVFLMLFPFVWHISKLVLTLSHCARY